MSLKSLITQVWQSGWSVVYRPPAVYAAVANDIFDITGPVLIKLLGGFTTAATGGATTLTVAINGVGVDAGAAVITAAGAGEVWVSPLNVAGVMAGQVTGLPLTDALLHPKGFLTGNGAGVVCTFGVATWTGSIFCVYQKLAPQSLITVA